MNKKGLLIITLLIHVAAYAGLESLSNTEQIAINVDLKPVITLIESITKETDSIKANITLLARSVAETNQLKEYIMRLENKIDILEKINTEHNKEILELLSKRIMYIEKAHKSLHKQKASTKKAIEHAQQMLNTIHKNTNTLIENNDNFPDEPIQ